MRVTVRLFASMRQKADREQIVLDLPAGARVADAWAALIQAHPEFAPYQETSLPAVNRRYVTVEAPLQDGDELAILPPVSGG